MSLNYYLVHLADLTVGLIMEIKWQIKVRKHLPTHAIQLTS